MCVCVGGTECKCVHMYVEAKYQFQESLLRRYLSCLFEIESVIGLELTHYTTLTSQQALDLQICIPSPNFYADVGDCTWVLMLG